MNNLNQYILEKLKVNSKSQVNKLNYFTEEIFNLLYSDIRDADPEEIKIINNWVVENNIENLDICTTKDVLVSYGFDEKQDMPSPEEIADEFNNKENISFQIIEKDTYLLLSRNKSEQIYTNKYDHIRIYLSKSKKMLIFRSVFAGNIFFIAKI